MYRPSIRPRDRVATIVLVVLIHVGLALAFLNLSGHLSLTDRQPDLQIFDVNIPPPPVIEVVKKEKARPKKQEGAASARNIESKATPVVRPKPRVVIPTPPKIVSSPTPRTGNEATQGASNVVGQGTGAGGSGTGSGSGGSGSGSGGGGNGGVASGVKVLRDLSSRDYPDQIIRRWPPGGRIFTRLRVEADGTVSRCDVMRSYGDALADQWTCALIMQQRARFRPATDASGRPISAWLGYIQAPTGEMYRR